jgi:ABC-type ATPase with predicted acetyltransferase domain
MQNINIVKRIQVDPTFRNSSVVGMFDLQPDSYVEEFQGIFDPPQDWKIGAIVGNSGTGKTTIAKELFPESYITEFEYDPTKSVIDCMPEGPTVSEIAQTFNSVGFSSPPSWLKPYAVLSNGQKMRADLARALLLNEDLIVFDEFTSVVDRNVAQIGSLAVQKAIRKTNRRFIAVTCHFDVLPWLMPDWVFDANDFSMTVFTEKKTRN